MVKNKWDKIVNGGKGGDDDNWRGGNGGNSKNGK